MIKELESYLTVLTDLRNQLKALLEKFPAEAIDWAPIKGEGDLATNSAAAIIAHLAGSEAYNMNEVIAERPIQRDREAEFKTKGVGRAELERRFEAGQENTKAILSSLTSAQLDEIRKYRDRTESVRQVILRVIAHFSLHLGHMQLTYQLWQERRLS